MADLMSVFVTVVYYMTKNMTLWRRFDKDDFGWVTLIAAIHICRIYRRGAKAVISICAALNPPDFSDKKLHFTSQNMGVICLLLPCSVSLFVTLRFNLLTHLSGEVLEPSNRKFRWMCASISWSVRPHRPSCHKHFWCNISCFFF